MKQSYELYGSTKLSMADLRHAIENLLELSFSVHESAYRGGEYLRAGDLGGEEFVIQRNTFDFDNEEEVAEPDFAQYPVIFWVAWTERGDELRNRLAEIRDLDFLRRTEH